jgi:photosystem II stability/assembly factor-like uncharacterized protein
MIKKILLSISVFVATFLVSGCSLPTSVLPTKNSMVNTTMLKSLDGGLTWNSKVKINDKKTIEGIDILSMAIHPVDQNIVYVGTMSNGLFMTKDGGEAWTQLPFADKAYGLVFDPRNPDVMYGSGVFNGRAKIFKRLMEGQEWKEIYTEPADGTTISTIAIDKMNPQVLYAGTSEGVIIKTTDGGQTWVNLKINADLKGPIVSIGFDAASDAHVFFAVFQVGVLETKNAGASIENITEKIDTVRRTNSIYTLTVDPYLGGVAYVGTGAGMFRRSGGDDWKAMNLIESSKAFPVRAIAVNPKNSKEIMYSSAKAIYKSIDTGGKWATFQLDTSKEISILKYDQADPAKIYAGMRTF